jgi:hypothetical protein
VSRAADAVKAWLDAYVAIQKTPAPLRALALEQPDLRADIAQVLAAIDQVTPSWKEAYDMLVQLRDHLALARLETFPVEPSGD